MRMKNPKDRETERLKSSQSLRYGKINQVVQTNAARNEARMEYRNRSKDYITLRTYSWRFIMRKCY